MKQKSEKLYYRTPFDKVTGKCELYEYKDGKFYGYDGNEFTSDFMDRPEELELIPPIEAFDIIAKKRYAIVSKVYTVHEIFGIGDINPRAIIKETIL